MRKYPNPFERSIEHLLRAVEYRRMASAARTLEEYQRLLQLAEASETLAAARRRAQDLLRYHNDVGLAVAASDATEPQGGQRLRRPMLNQ
jgi:hypothetical protein